MAASHTTQGEKAHARPQPAHHVTEERVNMDPRDFVNKADQLAALRMRVRELEAELNPSRQPAPEQAPERHRIVIRFPSWNSRTHFRPFICTEERQADPRSPAHPYRVKEWGTYHPAKGGGVSTLQIDAAPGERLRWGMRRRRTGKTETHTGTVSETGQIIVDNAESA